MKRHILILAAILLAACSKTETSYEAPSEIAFTPVAEGMTKAAVEGEGYMSDLPFNVFAQTTDGEAYFNNISFEPGNDKTDAALTVYEGNPTQYWPRTKNLKFAGYTGTSYPDAVMNEGFTQLTIAGYKQNADSDLMYFFDSGEGGKGYNTESGIVSPTMKHACAWITIKVTGQDACASWPIKQITVDGLSTSGTVIFESTPDVDWQSLGGNTDMTIFNTEATISTSPVAHAIVIPQVPVTLTVYYKDTSKSDISLQYDEDAAWKPGVHYTYTLNFLNPYKIDFTVDTVTPWDDTTPEITIQ